MPKIETFNRLVNFVKDEDGAATIDMVVLMAAGVATTVAMTNSARDTMSSLMDGIQISSAAVNTSTSFGNDGVGNGTGNPEG